MEGVFLEKIVYTFSQDCNTNGTTGKGDDYEELEVTVEAVADSIEKVGGFMVIRTHGWSINNPEELNQTLTLVANGVKSV